MCEVRGNIWRKFRTSARVPADNSNGRERKQRKKQAEEQKQEQKTFGRMEVTLDQALIRLSDIQQSKRMRLMDVFQKMDVNDDGMVSVGEFEAYLESYKLHVSEKDLKAWFAELDSLGSGYLNYHDVSQLGTQAAAVEIGPPSSSLS